MNKSFLPWALFLLVAACASIFSFWTTLGSYYYLDDYVFITLARYTDNPLAYFTSSHFPGSLFYRPSVFVIWWLTSSLEFGMTAHLMVNWLMLFCAGVLLVVLLLRLGSRTGVAFACGLLFVIHPIVIMTSGWLSNRFDLLATVGILLALIGCAGWYRQIAARPTALLAVGFGTALAVTSKELGYMLPIVVALMALLYARGNLFQRLLTAPWLLTLVLACIALAVRLMLLQGADRGTLEAGSATLRLTRGASSWLQHLPYYFSFSSTRPDLAAGLLILSILAVGATLVALRLWRRNLRFSGTHLASILVGASILVLAMLVQTPIVSWVTLHKPGAGPFDDNFYYAARFYYLATVGLLLSLAGLFNLLLEALSTPSWLQARRLSLVQVAACLLLAPLFAHWMLASREQGAVLTAHTAAQEKQIAQAAAEAVTKLEEIDSESPCRIYLLGTEALSEKYWHLSDSAVKALVSKARAHEISHCLIATERTPWYNIHRTGDAPILDVSNNGPFRPICSRGVHMAAQSVGSALFQFLSYGEAGSELEAHSNDFVLSYSTTSGTFVNMTEAARAGEMRVQLFWSRFPANECAN